MAKGKTKAGMYQAATVGVYIFLLAVLSTYWMPVMSVNLPAFGKKSWSVQDIVRALPKAAPGQKEEKSSKLSPKYDFFDLLKEISPKGADTKTAVKISPGFILGALVPVALALTYLLAILGLVLAFLKKASPFITTSVVSAACAVYTLLGTYYLSQMAQGAFSSSLAKIEGSPFAAITKNFVKEVTIQPETGLFALVVFTVLVMVIALYRTKI